MLLTFIYSYPTFTGWLTLSHHGCMYISIDFREIVNSKLFKHLTRDVLESKSNLFYSQFKMNLHERKRLIRRSYISPPRSLINRILEKVESH